jgi:hypothetical protein
MLTTALFCLPTGTVNAAEGPGDEDSSFIKVGDYQMTISSRTVTNYGKVEFADGTFALVINLSRVQAAAINNEIQRIGLAYLTVVVDGHVVHDEIPVSEVTIEPFFIGPLTERQVDKAFRSLGVSGSWICHEEFVADTRWLRDQSRDHEPEKS